MRVFKEIGRGLARGRGGWPWARALWIGLLLGAGYPVSAQTVLTLNEQILTRGGVTNQEVRVAGRSELRLTASGDPLPGSTVDLTSPWASVRLEAVPPSQVVARLLSRFRIGGAAAVPEVNVRVVPHGMGTLVMPGPLGVAPLEIFDGRGQTGLARPLQVHVAYDRALLGRSTNGASLRLRRGYMATVAQREDGTGVSRCYVAQDGDLEVNRLPAGLERNIGFVRVFPWRWVAKKGIAGNIHGPVKAHWWYNWNLDQNSTADAEYVGIRQTRWWPGLDQDWRARRVNHLLGFNEPDQSSQANLSVTDALGAWPDLLRTGLRVGAPAVTDGGVGWLTDFMSRADAAGLRVDYVPVHYYRCFGNAADPAGAANQFHAFLKGIHDVVKRPLWVTEWNNGANWTSCADPTPAQQAETVTRILQMLESTPFVERYALYNWVEDSRRLVWDDGSLTPAGVRYRDQASGIGFRQELSDGGAGVAVRYPFDGDFSEPGGVGHDLLVSGLPRFLSGKHGSAVSLNGTTDHIQISPRIGDSADFTFAAWVFWGGGGNWQRIFDLGQDMDRYLFLTPRSGAGTLRFAINTGSGEQQLNAPALTPNVWTHVAVTLSGNTGKLFVNGRGVATNTAMTLNPVDVGTKYNHLGRSQFPADPLFNGRLDEVRFSGTGLADAQVAALASVVPPRFHAARFRRADAVVGSPYVADLDGLAVGTGPLVFARMDGPAWLEVGPDGRLGGTPGADDGGLQTFRVRVTDDTGLPATVVLEIAVTPVVVPVASSGDDAEESATGVVSLTGSDLELVNDTPGGAGDQWVGLRFENVRIPRRAVVRDARLQFTADEPGTLATVLQIGMEASADAFPFSSAPRDVSSRARLPWWVRWEPPAWGMGQSGEGQRTPNLAPFVQAAIDREGWLPGNALVFVVRGTGRRTADAFDKPGGVPVRLTVEFAVEPAVTPAYQEWMDRWFPSEDPSREPGSDPDGDGYTNLFEFFHGLDPKVADGSVVAVGVMAGEVRLRFPWAVAAGRGGLRVEWTDDLREGPWQTEGLWVEQLSEAGPVRVVEARVPQGAVGARFVRIRAD